MHDVTCGVGSGKSHLMKKIIHKRAFTIRVDCHGISSMADFLEHFGDAIGFSPSFHTLNTLLNWLASFIPGLQKTGTTIVAVLTFY